MISFLIAEAAEATIRAFTNKADNSDSSTSALEELASRQEIEARVTTQIKQLVKTLSETPR